MAEIKINGMSFSGSSVVIRNNKVIVDGKDVTPDAKEIVITVDGNVELLDIAACQSVRVSGDAGSVKVQSGDVEVEGDVKGDVETMAGSINVGGNIGGDANTMAGNIRHRK
ncbi:MAG TPA: hypothetical protein VD862_03895 [Candidatus Paceibacterota bacterium]|nr:hypothetical protein [Candidatus Paceibacterota bacterium]